LLSSRSLFVITFFCSFLFPSEPIWKRTRYRSWQCLESGAVSIVRFHFVSSLRAHLSFFSSLFRIGMDKSSGDDSRRVQRVCRIDNNDLHSLKSTSSSANERPSHTYECNQGNLVQAV
jgi:hypothetical protein